MDRARNKEVRCRVGVREKMSDKVDRKKLKKLRHVERMGEERLTKRVHLLVVEGRSEAVGWSQEGCQCAVAGAVRWQVKCMDREQWRAFVVWMALWMYKVWPNIFQTPNNEEMDSRVEVRAGSLDSSRPMIGCVPPFSDGGATGVNFIWAWCHLHKASPSVYANSYVLYKLFFIGRVPLTHWILSVWTGCLPWDKKRENTHLITEFKQN